MEVAVGPAERGERMHALTGVPAGRVVVEYTGRLSSGTTPTGAATDDAAARDLVECFAFNRPSRYCPSDELVAFAA